MWMPGMMNTISPAMVASPTSTLTSSTEPNRWNPKHYEADVALSPEARVPHRRGLARSAG
jgi:hypothetical protein